MRTLRGVALGVASPVTLRASPVWGAAPLRCGSVFGGIICDGDDVINNLVIESVVVMFRGGMLRPL